VGKNWTAGQGVESALQPGRFEFILTPEHWAWLNLIEGFFSTVARSLLRHIRVATRKELIEQIYQGIADMNREPVIFHWRYKVDAPQSAHAKR